MKRKIIFLDIDGTLTEAGSNQPPDSALWAIRTAQKEGHFVFLCTGRNYDMLSPLLSYGFDGFIASSGGYVQCGQTLIYDCPMTNEQQEKAMQVLKQNGIYRTVECKDGSYTDEGFKEFLKAHASEAGNSELLRWREQIESALRILPMKEYKGQPIYKIVIMLKSKEQLIQPKQLLSEEFDFCIQAENQGGFLNGEIVNKKFNKGKAIEMVLQHLNLPISNSIAIGDSMNDKEMLETAGFAICMQNGSDAIKQIADDICPSVKEDGIREAFLKHIL